MEIILIGTSVLFVFSLMMMLIIDGIKQIKCSNAFYRAGNEDEGMRCRQQALMLGVAALYHWIILVVALYGIATRCCPQALTFFRK